MPNRSGFPSVRRLSAVTADDQLAPRTWGGEKRMEDEDHEIPANVRALILERLRILRELPKDGIRDLEMPIDPRKHPPRRQGKDGRQIQFWRGGITL